MSAACVSVYCLTACVLHCAVAAPEIYLPSPETLTVVEDTPVYIWCLSSGLPQPSVRWLFHRSVSAVDAVTIAQSQSSGDVPGVRQTDPLSQVLRIDAVQATHAGVYQCVVSNSLKTVSHNVTLSGESEFSLPALTCSALVESSRVESIFPALLRCCCARLIG